MNGKFYQQKFATGHYGGGVYDLDSLLPLLKLPANYRYLEVGVGKGHFLCCLAAAVEVKPSRICASDLENYLEPSVLKLPVPVEFQKIDLGASPLSYLDDSFDIVICNHVLEHIFETESALRELRRVLTHDGLCVVSVPNIANWWSRITFLICGELPVGLETGTESADDGLTWVLRRRFKDFKPSGHIRGFTPLALRDLCERCGLRFVGWWNQNLGWRNKMLKPMMGIVLRKG
jgi:2-polyprenyl-3-methyl-5-hydroxy-6-metoxy-1,4-benzoquinol methylase